MSCPTDLQFVHVGDWHLDSSGEGAFDLPASLRDALGLLLIEAGVPLLVASTSHFGPRVRDFMYARSGDTQSERVHRNITDLLRNGRQVSLWVLQGETARGRRSEVIAELKPIWNLR